ncbi:MAG: dTMP kinase [candidate division Zixibacteria bacterium]|nr:dTMP kinase [candidate division Zixibacteria bacterium]
MHKLKESPLFVTFEGIDGCGKTTQAMMTYHLLSSRGYKVKLLREPGSTAVSEKIREILLDRKLSMTDITELLLYEAARAEIVGREIAPLLKKGYVVLCDRFYDSTTAYQAYGRRLDVKMVKATNKIAVGRLVPTLTFLFDIDLKTAAARAGMHKDRLELQSKTFFNRVRLGFLEIARKERRRIKVVDASRPIETIFADVKRILARKIDLK